MTFSVAWKQVKCKNCSRTYQCTPLDDYYNATSSTDGVCERCLLGGAPNPSAWQLCDNCGMSVFGCDLFEAGTGRDCCSHCKHPEPKQPKDKDNDVTPLMRREEMVN